MTLRIITIVLLFVSAHINIYAQDILNFNHLDISKGLLHNSVTCLHQDELGYIWIGTQQGLNRYDGNKIDSYINSNNPSSAAFNNRIREICQIDSILCIATYNGLVGFDLKRKKYFEFTEKSKNKLHDRSTIQNMYVDSNSRIWISTNKRVECLQIQKIDDRYYLKPIFFGDDTFLNQSNINVLELSKDKYILRSGDRFDIFSFEDQYRMSRRSVAVNNLPKGYLYPIIIDGAIWVFTLNKVMKYKFEDEKMTLQEEMSYSTRRVSKVVASEDKIWVSSNKGLLSISKSDHAMKYFNHSVQDPFSVVSDHHSDILLDNSNNLWVSTWSTGISYANIGIKKFNVLRCIENDKESLPDEFVYAIHEDNEGTIYVGTKYGGISIVDVESNKVVETINLSTNKKSWNPIVTSINSDDKYLYATVTTAGSSVIRIDKKTHRVKELVNLFPSHVFSSTLDSFNQLWVGTLGSGLFCFKLSNGDIVNTTNYSNTLSSSTVNYIYYDREKHEVLASTTYGLNRLMLDSEGKVDKIASYISSENGDNSLVGDYLWAIDKECDSVYWIATLGQGLNRIVLKDREEGVITNYKSESFGVEHGAYSNVIEGVLVDGKGRIWCSGNNIACFDYSTKQFYNYFEGDGIQSNQFATGAAFQLKSGLMFFGGIRGLNYFKPFYESPKQENVKLTRLYIDDNLVEVGVSINEQIVLRDIFESLDNLELVHNNNNFTIDFSSLTYQHKNNTKFRCKLVGYDAEWQNIIGKNHSVTYKKLPFGRYNLLIQSGRSVATMMTVKELSIRVFPPWWLSIPAVLSYCLFVIIAVTVILYYIFRWMSLKSELKLQEEREFQHRELVETKMAFFTNVSHEFKTPLTLINAAIYKMSNINLTDVHLREFDVIKRNNQRLLNLISELMDFQKVSNSRKTVTLKNVNINEFVETVYDVFHPWAHRNNLQLTLNRPTVNVKMDVDEEILTKVLYNLISNSVKYSKDHGEIDIKYFFSCAKEVKSQFVKSISMLDDISDGEYLIFKILDNGVGIPAEMLASIFEKYFNNSGNSRGQLSSGVGLALVKSLIELHKGGFILSSEEGVGTEFIVLLPVDNVDYNTSQISIKREFNVSAYLERYNSTEIEFNISDFVSKDNSKPCILFVDDNIEILSMLYDYFRDDYYLKFATNGVEALNICSEYLPDIVVSDVMMPEMDGFELCSNLKSQISTCFVPVILLTACSSMEQERQGIDNGADFYIQKPFYFEILSSSIQNLLLKRDRLKTVLNGSTVEEPLPEKNERTEDTVYNKFIERFISVVEAHITESDFTVDNLCIEVGASRSKLYPLIKSQEGISLGDFIKKIRMRRAAELLRTTDMTISEVSYAVGITSPSFFSRIFKEYYNQSPSEYSKFF